MKKYLLMAVLFTGAANTDLVAHWTFDEGNGNVAQDSTANANNGTISEATWTAGQIGGALEFDGINDYVGVPDDISLDFSHSFSITAWLKPVTNPIEDMVWFGYHGASGGLTGKSLHLRMQTNGQIRFGLYSDDLTTNPDTISWGYWNHVVITYDYATARQS